MTSSRDVAKTVAIRAVLAATLAISIAGMPKQSIAATATTTMPVTMTITAGCQVTANALAFGSSGGLFSAVAANTTLVLTCTTTTPYTIGLDAGSGLGATTSVRKMTGPGAATITYSLYQNAGLTTNFGVTVGTDTVAGIGTGTGQTITVYGRVPAQGSSTPGSYSDIVNVTVTY